MRVAHVDAETGFSGGEKQVFLLMRGLRAHGVEPVLFCPPGSASEERARALDIEVFSVRMRGDLDAAATLRIKAGLRERDVQLVHLHTGRATWLGGWAARAVGLPAITTRRMDRPVRSGVKARLMYEGLTLRTAAISGCVAEQLLAGGVAPGRVVLIPSAVDPAELAPGRPRGAVRDELGAGPDEVIVLALGALVKRKGHDVLLDALDRLDPRPIVWIAGDGEERKALELKAGRLGDRVRLLGKRADVADLLGAVDLVAMPSRAEGLGVAALEAMAAGRAVVASAVGGLAEVVVEGRTGLLVPPGDAPALAAALGRLVEDADLRTRLGAAGPGRVAEGYLAEQMVASYLELYREVLELHARRS